MKKEDIELFHHHKLLIPARTIYLGSEGYDPSGEESGTDFLMVERFVKNMAILESINKSPITIIANNCGGDVHDGLAIYDRIRNSPCHVTMKIYGEASSMGSIILQACDLRIMSQNSVQLIHYGAFSISKEAKSAYKFVDEFKRTDKWMEKIYMDRIKKKDPLFRLGRLQRLLAHDTYLTAEQSLDLGLVDQIERPYVKKRNKA